MPEMWHFSIINNFSEQLGVYSHNYSVSLCLVPSIWNIVPSTFRTWFSVGRQSILIRLCSCTRIFSGDSSIMESSSTLVGGLAQNCFIAWGWRKQHKTRFDWSNNWVLKTCARLRAEVQLVINFHILFDDAISVIII